MPQIRGINVPKENNIKNYLMNGDMNIAQRGNSFPAIANGTYSLDRWVYYKVGAMVHTLTQDTDVPTLAQAGYLFPASLRLNLTTPDTSIAAGDIVVYSQTIEGYNFYKIAQKPMTLSFWVKATTAGIYCASFTNSGADRSYVAEYTVNSSNTWEYKSIVVPASPSGGTWNYNNGAGLTVRFALAAGTTYQTTAGSWQTGNFAATSNQVNGVNTGATDFRITGVMLNEGPVAAPFSLFAKGYTAEHIACQRYYELGHFKHFFGGTTGSKAITHSYRVPKRATPTLAFSGSNQPGSTETNDINYFQVLRNVNDNEINFDWTSASEL